MAGRDQLEEQEEQAHFDTIVQAFQYYHRHSLLQIDRIERNMCALKASDWDRLPPASRPEIKIPAMQEAVQANASLLEALTTSAVFSRSERIPAPQLVERGARASEFDMGKVRSTLRQYVREWSAEGAPEREQTFGVLLAELERRLPLVAGETRRPRVLIPGAGLGRLCYEVALRGYEAQGNEWSYFMLLGSNFILNRPPDLPPFTIQPWVHQQSVRSSNPSRARNALSVFLMARLPQNVLAAADQLRKVNVPDVAPTAAPPPDGSLSMCAGDFVEVYGSQRGQWDAVLTCFFIDTAKNVLEYIETIASCLKPGGHWINLGPLLYHFEEMDEASVELSMEEVYAVMDSYGLVRVQQEDGIPCSYTTNVRSMMRMSYHCSSFTAVKGAAAVV